MRWERVRQQNQQVGLGDSSSGPGKRWGHTCNAIKGGRFVYVFGGFGRDDCLTNQVHVFDAETQIWIKPVIKGVPPSPRDSHSCTTVGDNLFVFGGTDGKNHLKDLHVLDTSSHTWKSLDTRGEGPEAREAHSATLVGKRIFIFGGCGKSSGSDDEVFYNDLYILNTETLMWQRAVTTGNSPSARDSHTCSTWKNKIIVVGGEDLDDYYLSDVHMLDTETFVWKQLKTSGQLLTPRAGHVSVAIERNLFVFGGFTDSQNLYNDLYVLDVETGVWSKVVAMEEGPSARFSAAAVCLGPYKADSFFFVGGCNKNLEPLDDIYYLHTDGGYDARLDQTPERLSLRKQMKLKCQEQKLAVAGTSIVQGRENLPLSIGSTGQGKTVFQARVTENVPLGYTIETVIDGKLLRGVLFSNRQNSVQRADTSSSSRQRADTSSSSRKRPAVSDTDCRAKTQKTLSKDSAGSSQQVNPNDPSDDANKKVEESDDMDRAKTQKTLSKDSAGSSQQVNPIGPSDDANRKVQESDDMDTPMVDSGDANINIARQQVSDTDCDDRAKNQETLSKDSAGSSQQVDPIDPSDDANKKVAESDDMDTPMVATADADINIARPQEAETAAVTSGVRDQDHSQRDMDIVNAEPSPVTLDQANLEPLRNDTSTDVGAAAKSSPGGDSSPQKQDEGRVAAEDANAEQQPQP